MHHFLRFLVRICRFWWLLITLPRRERRAQAIWEDAGGPEPPPFEGVPYPMGYLELRGLWDRWPLVAQVLAAHNRRVDAFVEAGGGPVGATIVLEPDDPVRAYRARAVANMARTKHRFDWASAFGGAGSALVADLQSDHTFDHLFVDELWPDPDSLNRPTSTKCRTTTRTTTRTRRHPC